MSKMAELTPEQIARWGKAQIGEVSFWKEWMVLNPQQDDNQWLQYVIKYFNLSDNQNFGNETLIDLGSGPVGILTRFNAECRIAVDPLPIDTFDMTILRIKRPAEKSGLPTAVADRIFIYNLLQHVISPEHVLSECARLLKPNGTVYILEQLNLPTDNEHPHSLKIEMFDQWVAEERLQVIERKVTPDSILSSAQSHYPGSGYTVLCLVAKKPA